MRGIVDGPVIHHLIAVCVFSFFLYLGQIMISAKIENVL